MTTNTRGAPCRDHLLRRCWWCGDWQYSKRDCTSCTATAERPTTSQHTDNVKESA